MPLGRKRSVLISLCVNSCVFWQRPWKEGLKTINILSTMSYCYHIVESHQDFGTILTGDQQCNLGEARVFYHRNCLKPRFRKESPRSQCSNYISSTRFVLFLLHLSHPENTFYILETDIENKVRSGHQDVFSFSSLPHKPNPHSISFTYYKCLVQHT